MSELLPLFPLSTVLFPGMRLPLHVFEDRYRQLVADLEAAPEPRRFGIIAIRSGREVGADGVTALYEVGCVAAIRRITPHANGQFDLAAVGTQRFRLLSLDQTLPYFQGQVEILPDEAILPDETALPAQTALSDGTAPNDETRVPEESAAALAVVRAQAGFRAYLNALADRGGGVISIADLPDEPVLLSYVIGAAMIIDLPERQSLLAAPDALRRLRLERSLLTRETGILRATTTRPAPDYTYGRFSPN